MERVVLEAITVPTLIIQGQWSKVNPLEFAQEITRNLVNVEGGARLYTIRGRTNFSCHTGLHSCMRRQQRLHYSRPQNHGHRN